MRDVTKLPLELYSPKAILLLHFGTNILRALPYVKGSAYGSITFELTLPTLSNARFPCRCLHVFVWWEWLEVGDYNKRYLEVHIKVIAYVFREECSCWKTLRD